MCKVYNSVGCLKVIMYHLNKHNIREFNSLSEIINFQKTYTSNRQLIISKHKAWLEQEKKSLLPEITQLNTCIEDKKSNIEIQLCTEINRLKEKLNNLIDTPYANFLNRCINSAKIYLNTAIIRYKERNIYLAIKRSVQKEVNLVKQKNNRYYYIIDQFENALYESAYHDLREIDEKKRVIDEINNYIYGALGEEKVVDELKKLSDDYILINDFSLSFRKPIYNRKENDYIWSIQIDHLLITSSGIFLIETKNWNKESLNEAGLRSPVKQIQRTNFALYRILNEEFSKSNRFPLMHHWGNRKISIRNLLVFTNLKPHEEFPYVKVLNIPEMIRYIKYFPSANSYQETQAISDYLLSVMD